MAKIWKDWPDTTTPLTAAELNRIENAIVAAQNKADNANTDNVVMIDGVAYQASGKMTAPAPVWSGTSPIFYATLALAKPFEPPIGWCFIVTLRSTSGFTFVGTANGGAVGQPLQARVLQIASNATNTLGDIVWQLVKAY